VVLCGGLITQSLGHRFVANGHKTCHVKLLRCGARGNRLGALDTSVVFAMPYFLRYLLPLMLAGLLGCAGAPRSDTPPPNGSAAPGAPHMLRIVVKVPPVGTFPPDRLVREITRISGLPAQYGAVIGNQWHGLVLVCPDIVACNTAIERLEFDTSVFESVQRDGRRQAHAAVAL
jgi:hypothetical protein